MKTTLYATLVDELIDQCAIQGHEHERLSKRWVQRCCRGSSDEQGLAVLALAIMNLGVCIDDDHQVQMIDTTFLRNLPPDPARDGWRGRPGGLGKHLTDYSRGGLLGPHYDGSALRHIYAVWGQPPGVPAHVLGWHYNAILRSEHSPRWLEWAAELVERREVIVWSIQYWIDKYWNHRLVRNTSLPARIVRARVANSRPGWLRGLDPEASYLSVARHYRAKKWDEAPGRIDRTERQLRYTLRAAMLWELTTRRRRYANGKKISD